MVQQPPQLQLRSRLTGAHPCAHPPPPFLTSPPCSHISLSCNRSLPPHTQQLLQNPPPCPSPHTTEPCRTSLSLPLFHTHLRPSNIMSAVCSARVSGDTSRACGGGASAPAAARAAAAWARPCRVRRVSGMSGSRNPGSPYCRPGGRRPAGGEVQGSGAPRGSREQQGK